jgi:hypothetical protein
MLCPPHLPRSYNLNDKRRVLQIIKLFIVTFPSTSHFPSFRSAGDTISPAMSATPHDVPAGNAALKVPRTGNFIKTEQRGAPDL